MYYPEGVYSEYQEYFKKLTIKQIVETIYGQYLIKNLDLHFPKIHIKKDVEGEYFIFCDYFTPESGYESYYTNSTTNSTTKFQTREHLQELYALLIEKHIELCGEEFNSFFGYMAFDRGADKYLKIFKETLEFNENNLSNKKFGEFILENSLDHQNLPYKIKKMNSTIPVNGVSILTLKIENINGVESELTLEIPQTEAEFQERFA